MKKLAEYLLSIKAVELRPEKPFTWASGIKSPIYCDNRQTLSYPEIRSYIKNKFSEYIKQNYKNVSHIAGVATGAIAIGALVADALDLPFVYVRAKAKQHGRRNLIEGKLPDNADVVVIEDLISTGGSSMAAVDALRKANANVLGLVAIFSYGFDLSEDTFKKGNCEFNTLTNYKTMLEVAVEKQYIDTKHISVLHEWRKNFVKS